MTFAQIALDYFYELKKEVAIGETSGEATSELSYRTSLDNFFKKLAYKISPKIATIPEPKNQNKLGRPDWRFHDTESMGIYGYVEAKGLDKSQIINVETYRSQVERYLILGNPVLLTDGVDFVMFRPDGTTMSISLFAKPVIWDEPHINPELEVMFQLFFKQPGYREISDGQLINEVAKRARLLSVEIQELLHLDDDEADSKVELGTIRLLKQLKKTSSESHDRSLINDVVFSGFISQILTFGLLYAHRVVERNATSPFDKYEKIHNFWFSVLDEDYSNKLIPFKTLVHELNEELSSDLSRLGVWYDDLRRMLAYIRLSRKQVKVPDFHELYETFLSVYDPVARFDYGAFYTPRSLAYYTVSFVEKIIRDRMAYFSSDTPLKVIDPCCGTGTFIEAILDRFKVLPTSEIIGFEILPAPYALAHYRMAMLKKNSSSNIRIILTNTLSDSIYGKESEGSIDSVGALLEEEQKLAQHLSTPPLTIIIGNPPSSDSHFIESNEGSIINSLLEDFKPDLSSRTSRQNTQKQLSNEFVKFLRWTVDRAEKSKPSVFALIVPSSFSKHPSYKFARKYLSEKCNEIWVLEFDNDKRRGSGGLNLFNTLQGRMLLVATLKTESREQLDLRYENISDMAVAQKLSYFAQEPKIDEWEKLVLDENFTFRRTESYDSALYSQFWPLSSKDNCGIFLRHCSSLKLAPTHLLVHTSKGQLKRRSKFISKPENTYSLIKEKWYSGQSKPPPEKKLTPEVKILLEHAANRDCIRSYSYRPFVSAYVLLDGNLLSSLASQEGSGTRDRPEIRAAFADKRVFGFAVSPAPEDIGDSLHKFSSFCWNVPDNDLSARGNAHVFCNFFPEYKKGKSWDSSVIQNINPLLLSRLKSEFRLTSVELMDLLTFYCYAVLSSTIFLEQFKGKLFSVAGVWPSLPITSNRAHFMILSELGNQLAKIESEEYFIETLSESEHFSFEFQKYRILTNQILLQDINGKTLYSFNDVPVTTLTYEISGYVVIREWLKMYSYPYYRKAVTNEEISRLKLLISKLSLYHKVIGTVDNELSKILILPLIPFEGK